MAGLPGVVGKEHNFAATQTVGQAGSLDQGRTFVAVEEQLQRSTNHFRVWAAAHVDTLVKAEATGHQQIYLARQVQLSVDIRHTIAGNTTKPRSAGRLSSSDSSYLLLPWGLLQAAQ